MSETFRILEVYRTPQRGGPILVGKTGCMEMRVGSHLVAVADPDDVVEVLAVDLPTAQSLAEGRLAVVVRPDLRDKLCAGAEFTIISPDS